jgi:tetratricopeptide (TPR) repeat protein
MNIIRMTALIGFLAIGTVTADPVFAEENAASAPSGVSQAISEIEQAIAEIGKSDFNTAQVHMKAARNIAENIGSDDEQIKKANALVIQGQIQAKKGDIEKATKELNKALEIYRSL